MWHAFDDTLPTRSTVSSSLPGVAAVPAVDYESVQPPVGLEKSLAHLGDSLPWRRVRGRDVYLALICLAALTVSVRFHETRVLRAAWSISVLPVSLPPTQTLSPSSSSPSPSPPPLDVEKSTTTKTNSKNKNNSDSDSGFPKVIPLLADLDNDGYPELVVAAKCTLRLYHLPRGTHLSGHGRSGVTPTLLRQIVVSVASGDLDQQQSEEEKAAEIDARRQIEAAVVLDLDLHSDNTVGAAPTTTTPAASQKIVVATTTTTAIAIAAAAAAAKRTNFAQSRKGVHGRAIDDRFNIINNRTGNSLSSTAAQARLGVHAYALPSLKRLWQTEVPSMQDGASDTLRQFSTDSWGGAVKLVSLASKGLLAHQLVVVGQGTPCGATGSALSAISASSGRVLWTTSQTHDEQEKLCGATARGEAYQEEEEATMERLRPIDDCRAVLPSLSGGRLRALGASEPQIWLEVRRYRHTATENGGQQSNSAAVPSAPTPPRPSSSRQQQQHESTATAQRNVVIVHGHATGIAAYAVDTGARACVTAFPVSSLPQDAKPSALADVDGDGSLDAVHIVLGPRRHRVSSIGNSRQLTTCYAAATNTDDAAVTIFNTSLCAPGANAQWAAFAASRTVHDPSLSSRDVPMLPEDMGLAHVLPLPRRQGLGRGHVIALLRSDGAVLGLAARRDGGTSGGAESGVNVVWEHKTHAGWEGALRVAARERHYSTTHVANSAASASLSSNPLNSDENSNVLMSHDISSGGSGGGGSGDGGSGGDGGAMETLLRSHNAFVPSFTTVGGGCGSLLLAIGWNSIVITSSYGAPIASASLDAPPVNLPSSLTTQAHASGGGGGGGPARNEDDEAVGTCKTVMVGGGGGGGGTVGGGGADAATATVFLAVPTIDGKVVGYMLAEDQDPSYFVLLIYAILSMLFYTILAR